jgi:large subunit ribosomal protein L32
MPNPKRRHSRTRGRRRRTHYKVTVPNVVDCPNCHQSRLPHHVCPHCGFYDGRRVITVEEV